MSRLPISLLGTIVVCAGFASAAEPGPWQPVQLPPEAAGSDLRGIFFLDDRHGWIRIRIARPMALPHASPD